MKRLQLISLFLTLFVSMVFGFDFWIEPPLDTAMSVYQGSMGINAIHVNLITGPQQPTLLTVSGLPSGTMYQFLPDSLCRFDSLLGKPPYASTFTLRIFTSTSTPLGGYRVIVTGQAGSIARSTSFGLNITPIPSTGTVYYVDAGVGNDANAGSSTSPFKTVQKGADIAHAGDVVYVRKGLYRGRIKVTNSGEPGKPILFLGESGAILDGGSIVKGWTSCPQTPQGTSVTGMYSKPVSEIGFVPRYIAWNDKWCMYYGDDNDPGVDWNYVYTWDQARGWEHMNLPATAFQWEAYGAIGINKVPGLGISYVKFRDGANPDTKYFTLAPMENPTFDINAKSYIILSGFLIRNGAVNVWLRYKAHHNIIRHNSIRGGLAGVQIGPSIEPKVELDPETSNNTVQNNDITGDMHYPDVGHYKYPGRIEGRSAWEDEIQHFVYNTLRHWTRFGGASGMAISPQECGSVNICFNHTYRFESGIRGWFTGGQPGTLRIQRNYFHHNAGYNFSFKWITNSLDSIIISENLIYETTDNWRQDGLTMRPGGVAYIYKNRMGNLSGASTADYGFTNTNSSFNVYVYHNSMNGRLGVQTRWWNCAAGDNAKNNWFVNNILTAEAAYDGSGCSMLQSNPTLWNADYNWVGSNPGEGIELFGSMGTHNRLFAGTRMWDYINPSYFPSTTARGFGIDLSKPWTFNGVQHPALPGMENYYAGNAHDVGVFQYANTPPVINNSETERAATGTVLFNYRILQDGHIAFSYSIPKSQPVSLQVYDVQGNLIRTLTNGETPKGHQQLMWEGNGANGNKLSNGIYFVEFKAGAQKQTMKMIMIRN